MTDEAREVQMQGPMTVTYKHHISVVREYQHDIEKLEQLLTRAEDALLSAGLAEGENDLTIHQLVSRAYENSASHGFWDVPGQQNGEQLDPRDIHIGLAQLMLITTEIAEAAEAMRNGNDESLAEELADIVIRTAQFIGALGFDLEKAILGKMRKNELRQNMHGRRA